MQSKIDMWRKLFGTSKSKAPRSAGPTPLTEAERKEAEESMRTGGTPPAITDDERKKKIDEFEAKYRQAI
jgi:hypothetical protein